MAARVGILDTHQADSAQPRTFVKRSVADLLLRRLLAKRVGNRVIKLLIVKGLDGKDVEIRVPKKYIPEKMPPLNVPNTKFVEPQSVTWKLEHRNADKFFREMGQAAGNLPRIKIKGQGCQSTAV